MNRPLRALSLFILLFAASTVPQATLYAQSGSDALIVQCARPCSAIRAVVASSGGEVTREYQNIDAIAVRVPKSATATLMATAGPTAVHKDVVVNAPSPAIAAEVSSSDASTFGGEAPAVGPANYNYNLTQNNVASLHAAGKTGQNIVVAVIDSGSVNVPASVPALANTIVGGETFVPAAIDARSATHRQNGSHGTMTAEMVASHGAFVVANTSVFVQALNMYMPGSAIPCTSFPAGTCAATSSVIFLTGTAPGAKVYAMKVFPAQGGGASSSWIVAAMDRAITLRRNFNTTGVNTVASGTGTETDPFVYSSLKIDVVNMSLGGPTLFAGHDLEDQLTLAMLDAGITPVVSAGNDGHAAMTIGSPGSGYGSLTVGAASTSPHERVVREQQYRALLGVGAGALYRPTTHTQTASFSSRGPNADGRNDPDITANGAYSFVHAFMSTTAAGALVDCVEPGAVGACTPRLVFASGTSFSGPTVAGGAAVLRGIHPTKNATQIRNALHNAANPAMLGDDSTSIDMGKGYLDVAAADALLATGKVSSKVPDVGGKKHHDGEDDLGAGGGSVTLNVMKAGHRIAQFRNNKSVTQLNGLKPGEVAQIFVPSDPFTSRLTVTIDQITPALPPAGQNQLFGDDVFFMIADAPTSFLVERASGFTNVDSTTVVEHPQTGLVRVAVQGDWTNAGNISARVTVTRERSIDLPSALSIIEQDEVEMFEFDVPAASAEAVFELAWKQNWSRFPTNDLDMVLIDPNGNVNQAGATAASPERVRIANPTSGRWTVAVVGFTVYGNFGHVDDDDTDHLRDIFVLRAEADGKRLRQK